MFIKFIFGSVLLIIYNTDISTSFSFGKQKACQPYVSKMPSFDHKLRISERKCAEYKWRLQEREREANHSCKRTLFVIRGQRTKPAEYPHMGALGWMSRNGSWIFLCGSTLISERFVLTSAHCTSTRRESVTYPHPKIVRLGVTNIYKSTYEIPLDINIKKIIKHKKFSSPKKYYDIALLKLEKEVEFTKFVHPACLWSHPNIHKEGKEFTVTGWGATDKNVKFSPDLLFAKVDIFDTSTCQFSKLLNRNWFGVSNHQMCAGKLDGSTDTCYGDSGGPIQYKLLTTRKHGTMHMVIGITSFGSNICGQKNVPTIYTLVSSFIPWIERHVWPDLVDTSSSFVFQT